jgi:outer membrane protein assembly factor BamA
VKSVCFLSITFFIALLSMANIGIAQNSEDFELTSIIIEGNTTFPDSEIKNTLHNKENPWWFWRFLNSFTPIGSHANYFDSTKIPLDILSLKSFYIFNGYFNANISSEYRIDSSANSAELTYTIEENDAYTYEGVNTFGYENLSDSIYSRINPYLTYPDNQRFIQSDIEKNNTKVIMILKDLGYMLATSDSTIVEIDTVTKKVNLYNYFTTGKYYTYNELRIVKEGESQDLIDNKLIEYVSNIKVGDSYSDGVMSESRLRLARTGLFSSINLNALVEDTVANQVPLIIKGEIESLNELSPELFADNEYNTFNVGMGVNYIRKNFFGSARKLTIGARLRFDNITNIDLSSTSFSELFTPEIDLSIILEQPYLFSRNIAGGLEFYYRTYNIPPVDNLNYGVKITTPFDLFADNFINLLEPYITLDWLDYSFPLPIASDTATTEVNDLTSSLGIEVGSNNSNDIYFPTKGRIISLLGQIASTDLVWKFGTPLNLLGDWNGYYYKLQLTLINYFTVSWDDNSVVGVKAKWGHIQMIKGGSELIAPNQTFFAGGSNSIRGWKARQLIPSDTINTIIPPSLNEELYIRGGNIKIEGSFEYRYRFEEDFGLAFFVDYGNTWNNYKDVTWDQIAVAIGTGFRYYSSIVPFRIDFGFKFYDPADKKFIFDTAVFKTMEFHLGIGEAF